ncbi:MAG: hypothetical protein C0473_02780 [Cyanobacteria bacterium DS3.002]|jgi:hypothetical protein|nr:hypothetical protein [Cyanobacteria bacterium DS3.002]
MSDDKIKDKGDYPASGELLRPALDTADTQQVRNASASELEAIKKANPDASDGSATPRNRTTIYAGALMAGQDKSIELFDRQPSGQEKLVAARVMPEVAKQALLARENLEQQSKTVEKLTRQAKENPVYEPILALRKHADGMDPGEQKNMLVQLSKDQTAELRGLFRQAEVQPGGQVQPGKQITIGQRSYSPNDVMAYDNQQKDTATDATNATAPKSDQELDDRPLYNLGLEQKEASLFATGIGYLEGYKKPEITTQVLFERVAALPLYHQALVFAAGIQAYKQEIDHQQYRIAVGCITGVGESVVGMAQGADSLGKSICEAAQFSRDLVENNPRASDTAEAAGHSFGKLLVGGIRVFDAADNYLGSVGAASYEGDHTKAFRDISELGHQMNQKWQSMSPEEKTRLTTRLAMDNLGPIAAAGAVNRLAKSMDVVGALQDLGKTASTFGGRERDKYQRFIGEIIEQCEPELVTNTGDRLKWRDVSKTAEQAADENISRMSPYFEKGKKAAIEGGSKRAAELTGLPEKQIKKLVKDDPRALERMTNGQMIYMEKVYRETYLTAHPEYRNYSKPFEVHHRIPQDVLERHPQLFSHREIHDASNLVGIPRDTKAHAPIKDLWKDFLDKKNVSRSDIIDFANKIDEVNKRQYLP